MPKHLIVVCLLLCGHAYATETRHPWTLYSSVDVFAFSEPVSIDQFARDFQDDLEDGDTAFTHNTIEVGVRWRGFSMAAVQRFDYVTRFTDDTAFFHHSDKNNNTLPQDRDYDLLLDVERVTATGLKLGYRWNFAEGMTLDVGYSYYSDLKSLQSGKASIFGDPEPLTEQLKADVQAVLDGIDSGNRDLTPLLDLVRDINGDTFVNYAYDDPKFGEESYRKPTIVGDPNPLISGVDFSSPGGSGYALDIGFNWQVNSKLNLDLKLIDIVNRLNWDNAPQTRATFDLNPFLVDAINVAQAFVNGEVVSPNDIIDRHLFVEIFNADYEQELPWRADFEASYQLDTEVDVFGWKPALALMGGWYHTDTKEFPRLGVELDNWTLAYDIGGEALSVGYEGKYGFFRFVSDDFGFKNASTFGISGGLTFSF